MEEQKSATMQSFNVEENNLEAVSDQKETTEERTPKRRKGGLITMPFILASESFEKVASYGLLPNMILYLLKDYHLGFAQGNNIIFFWSAATNFMPLIGAFLSDSYLGRFLTIGLGSIASFLGMTLLWLTAMLPQARPSPCNQLQPQSCSSSPTAAQMTLLLASFGLMSLGAGGVRPCTLAFGADQIDRRDDPNKNKRMLESFFGWYYASASFSVLIALTGIVYIQDHLGWKVGFGIPASLMLLATVLFFVASPIYVKQKATRSLFTSFVQVAVAAYRNRKLPLPPHHSSKWFHHKDSLFIQPTEKIRCLNKACVVKDPEKDISPDGSASDPWSLCTVEQVEELKTLIKVIPIWSTGVMMSINVSQSSFPLLQAKSMNRHITSGFQIPAGSFGTFVIITIVVWVILYDRVILPLASKIRGKPVHFGVKARMGAGLVCSFLAMALSAIVENIRRRKAIDQDLLNDPNAVVEMSALWLVPQHCLSGLAEALNAIGQSEFYYSEFPKTMSSVASSLFGLGMAVANLLASAIMSTVDSATSRGGKESWVSKDINRGHYENYYWILAILSAVNIFYYLVCSWAYGPCVDEQRTAMDDGKISSNEEELSMLEARVRDDEGKELQSGGGGGGELPKPKELQA